MQTISIGIALLVGCAIIAIGTRYLTNPRTIAPSFGLPLPEDGHATTWWLRLKGVRDVASGFLVLSLTTWGEHRALGIVLLVLTLIPLGDMVTVLAAKGRTGTALGVHGLTALVMLLGAVPLLTGVR
jgi:hypothetical protein